MAREWLLRGVKPEELERTVAPQEPTTPRGKLANFWYHYKWHTIGFTFLLAVLIVMVTQMFTRNTPDYRVLLLTDHAYPPQEVDTLELMLVPYGEDLDGDGTVEIHVNNCMLGEQVKQQYSSNIQMFQANLMAGDVMCFIWDPKTYQEQIPAVEELMQEGNVFLAQLPIEHEGLSEDGCAYNWKGSAQQQILTDLFPKRFPEEFLFTVRHPNGTAEGSEELYKQGLELIQRLAAASEEAPEGFEMPTTTAAKPTTTTTTGTRITVGKTEATKKDN